jgi:hypothetical protein
MVARPAGTRPPARAQEVEHDVLERLPGRLGVGEAIGGVLGQHPPEPSFNPGLPRNYPQRVQVSRRPHLAPERLFGGHIGRGPDRRPHRRDNGPRDGIGIGARHPKSAILTRPSAVASRFSGLRSRWTIDRL